MIGRLLDMFTGPLTLRDRRRWARSTRCAGAWQVTVYDPKPGRNDMWPVLLRAANRQQRRRGGR